MLTPSGNCSRWQTKIVPVQDYLRSRWTMASVRAARVHATKMAAQEQLSHQFSGEPSLTDRISATSALHLDRAGENVAMAANPDQAHEALMARRPIATTCSARNSTSRELA